MTRAVRVALVDSGVHAGHPHVRGQGEVEHAALEGEAAGPGVADELGHGTAACAAVLDLAPGCRVLSLPVFRGGPTAPFARVLAALRAALAWEADLVNVSLGTREERWDEELADLARAAAQRGARIVAPALQGGLPCRPGCLSGFEGVLVDAALPRDRPELRPSGARTYWFAAPWPRDLPGLARERNLHGASFAAANVTGFLARELQRARCGAT